MLLIILLLVVESYLFDIPLGRVKFFITCRDMRTNSTFFLII